MKFRLVLWLANVVACSAHGVGGATVDTGPFFFISCDILNTSIRFARCAYNSLRTGQGAMKYFIGSPDADPKIK